MTYQLAATSSNEVIKLSVQEPFTLGKLEVSPSTRQVTRNGASETLEPRVMQVLVALARANGAVVDRNGLTASCWEGRIVGENAINRVISRVRSLAAGLGDGSFQLETITKVGYRLVIGDEAIGVPPPEQSPITALLPNDRRVMLAGTLAIMIGGAGLLAWQESSKHQPLPEVAALYAKGIEAQRQGHTQQAIAYLREATGLDPDYADAWGALALSYRHRLESDALADHVALAGWIRSAANRALALDPGNGDAKVALILTRPIYRNWLRVEADCRDLLPRYPEHWLLRGSLGRVLYDVGRVKEGIEPFRQNIANDPFLPFSRMFLAQGLWSAGRLQEAESALDAASARWPSHPVIWFYRFNFLAYTGRPAAALAFASDVGARPPETPPAAFVGSIARATALETRNPQDVESALSLGLEAVARDIGAAPAIVTLSAALGRLDTAFALLDRYYFGKGNPVDVVPSKIGPLTRRYTDFLFAQPTAPLRLDRRFDELTQAIGLEDYWRTTGSKPDYRR